MASPSTHAMPEHWTELSAARKQRRLCSEAIRALRSSCDQGCETKPAAECASCYAKALERIRLRYVDSRDREWFTQRGAFLPELEGLLQDAKGRATTLELVEARIESEKEAWYRWVLRRYPEFLAVADHGPASHGALRAMLDDADRSRQELVAAMLEGIGTPAGWPRSVDALADKAAAATSGDELKALYIGQFFEDGGSGRALDHAGKYLDEYRARDGGRLEDVMDSIASDLRESRRARPQREGHLRRLDELRRAKTAFEHNKARAKSRAPRSSQAPAPAGRLGALPPCHVCRGTVDRSAVLSCSLCQAAAQMGGSSGGGDLTVYCSAQCFCKGHVRLLAPPFPPLPLPLVLPPEAKRAKADGGGAGRPRRGSARVRGGRRVRRAGLGGGTRARVVQRVPGPGADDAVLLGVVRGGARGGAQAGRARGHDGGGGGRGDGDAARGGRDAGAGEPGRGHGPRRVSVGGGAGETGGKGEARSRRSKVMRCRGPGSPDCVRASVRAVSSGRGRVRPPQETKSGEQTSPRHGTPHPSHPSPLPPLSKNGARRRRSPRARGDGVRGLPRDQGAMPAERPFELLAMLAVAAGPAALYDEEFRRVLAFKYVAGGERSPELLRGLLIYCAWYYAFPSVFLSLSFFPSLSPPRRR